MSGHIEPLLPDYLKGDLPAPEREEVRKHLEGCAHCRGEMELFAEVERLAAESANWEPSEEIWGRISARLAAAPVPTAAPAPATGIGRRYAARPHWAWLAVAASLLLFISSSVLVRQSEPDGWVGLYEINIPVARGNPFLTEASSQENPFFRETFAAAQHGDNPFAPAGER